MSRETADEPDLGERPGAFGKRKFRDGWSRRARAGVLAIGHESIIADCAEDDWTKRILYARPRHSTESGIPVWLQPSLKLATCNQRTNRTLPGNGRIIFYNSTPRSPPISTKTRFVRV